MPRVSLLFAATWLVFCAGAASADAPDVKSLFPAGAQRGQTVEVTASGVLKPWPVPAHVVGTGVRLEPTKTEGKYSLIVAADAAPGIRWVRFSNDDGVSPARPLVIGTLAESNEKEPNDDLPQALDVGTEPCIVNGALAKGDKGADVDVFRVHLKKGQTLVAAADANRPLGSPIDGVLQLVSAGGFVLAQSNDELGLDARLVFVAPQEADYYVRLFGFPSVGTSSIRYVGDPLGIYRLTLTTGPYVDFTLPPVASTASASAVSGLGAKLSGWNLSTSTKLDATTVGTLRLPTASPAPERDAATPIVLESPTGSALQSISAPVVVAGRIDRPGDRDAYSMKVLKNQGFQIRVISQEFAFPVDPLLKIESPDGTQLLRSDDGKRGEYDVDAAYRAAADGEIRLIVEDLFGAGGERFVYLLDVRALEPDFTLVPAASELFGRVDAELEIPITVDRLAGLAGDIDVRIEGLPPEFGTVAAVSTAKGDSAKKVTLKFKPTKPFSGLIRIVGTSTEPPPTPVKPGAKEPPKAPTKPSKTLRRTAVVKIASLPGASVDEIFLVVGPAAKKAK